MEIEQGFAVRSLGADDAALESSASEVREAAPDEDEVPAPASQITSGEM